MSKQGPPKNYMTPRGFKRLRDEHRWMRLIERPKIVEEVAYAASLGDRSENAEYIYGKRRLRQIDRRLRWLTRRLRAAEVVDPAIDRGDRVFFGATVVLGYPDGAERTVQLVGEDEIEADKGRISWRSPIGKAIMRRQEADLVTLITPDLDIEIEIVEVSYHEQEPDPPSRWDQAVAAGRQGPDADAPLELPDDLEELDEPEDDEDPGDP